MIYYKGVEEANEIRIIIKLKIISIAAIRTFIFPKKAKRISPPDKQKLLNRLWFRFG